MKLIFKLILLLSFSFLSATEFTICSYNCGGLSDYYDYLRAVSMQKVMQERYIAEPENMALNETIQKLALKILFSKGDEKNEAIKEWDKKGYQHSLEALTASPTEKNSLNAIWHQKVNDSITSYQIRPVEIFDFEIKARLSSHGNDLKDWHERLAKEIFTYDLRFDIICLQEADYITSSFLPSNYEVLFSNTEHSVNGIAWNKDKFELLESLGNILGRAFAVNLLNKESGKTILVASGHITGCNPYKGGKDSFKGDKELKTIVDLFNDKEADIKLIGLDSNVTSLHPRLNILKQYGYFIDYENFLEPTCTNPYQVLNTRIDWIALKSNIESSIVNIPVLNVCLNSITTNMSDHKPVAAKVKL